MPLGVEVLIVRPVPGPLALDLRFMPYSHSLLAGLTYGAAIATAGAMAGRARAGLAIGAAVASHWFVDLLVHTPDLHIGLGEPRVGLGLWSWPLPALLLELALLAGCALLLRDRLPATRLWAVIGAMVVVQVGFTFGPLLPGPGVLAVASQLGFVLWAAGGAWIERGRTLEPR